MKLKELIKEIKLKKLVNKHDIETDGISHN